MKEIVEKAMEYGGKKADYLEIRAEKSRYSLNFMKNGTLSASTEGEDSGIAIRALVGGGMGVAYTNRIEWDRVKSALDHAVEQAKKVSGVSDVRLSEEGTHRDFWTVEQKRKIADVDNAEKVGNLKEIDSALVESGIPVVARIQILRDTIKEKHIMTSEGTDISSLLPTIEYMYFIVVAGKNGSEQAYSQLGWTGGYDRWDEWDPKGTVTGMAAVLNNVINNGKTLKSGKMDLIVGPEVTGIASHESCGHPSEADRILGREAYLAGESFIKPDMIGQRIGSDVVNVVDDPTVPNSFGYYKYDDEGVPARRRYLYKNGIINEFLQNRETAAITGTHSNGAARASGWDREPIVRMSTTFVEPGDHGKDELFEDVKYGIYMKSFTEWNIDDVRFNQKYTGREAYLIENGEIKGPIRRPVIELTTKTFWSSVDAVGKDLEFVGATCGKSDPEQGVDVWTGGPHMRLRDVYMRW